MVMPGETSLSRLRAVAPIKFAARLRASAARRSSLSVSAVEFVADGFAAFTVFGLWVTSVVLMSGFLGLWSLIGSSAAMSGLVGWVTFSGSGVGSGCRTGVGCGRGTGCATWGAGFGNGSGGGGFASG